MTKSKEGEPGLSVNKMIQNSSYWEGNVSDALVNSVSLWYAFSIPERRMLERGYFRNVNKISRGICEARRYVWTRKLLVIAGILERVDGKLELREWSYLEWDSLSVFILVVCLRSMFGYVPSYAGPQQCRNEIAYRIAESSQRTLMQGSLTRNSFLKKKAPMLEGGAY